MTNLLLYIDRYADDMVMFKIGRTVAESVAELQVEIDIILRRANENMIDFNPEKSELLVIGGEPKKKLDVSSLSLQIRGYNIITSPAVRWLGIWLDSQLNFKQHVQEWCGKAQRISSLVRQLNTVQRGTAPGSLIRAVQACVLSTVLYGAKSWWPGLTRITTQRGKKVGTGMGWHTELIDRTILRTVRAALSVWRTTPNTVLHRESGIPPAAIVLQQKRFRAAARIQKLDTWHPPVIRSKEEPKDTIYRLGLRAGLSDRT